MVNHNMIHATPTDATLAGSETAIDPNGTLPTMVWSPIKTRSSPDKTTNSAA
jgi:hypothetical protein